jgi:hypothetical protein
LLDTAGRSRLVLSRDVGTRLVSDRWELDWTTGLVAGSGGALARLTLRGRADGGVASTLFISLALVLLLLLTSLPLFADLFEFCDK